jgi:hypothetical protein
VSVRWRRSWGTAALVAFSVMASLLVLGPGALPASATTTGAAAPPPEIASPPQVLIETMETNLNQRGVALQTTTATPLPGCPAEVKVVPGVSRCFYADQKPGSWVQLVVLNRSTLALVSNTDIACPEATQKNSEAVFNSSGYSCTLALSNFIGSLNSGDLVIAVNQPDGSDPKAQPPVGLDAVLGSVGSNKGIGGSPSWFLESNGQSPKKVIAPVRGTYSIVGVPGWAPGTAVTKASSDFGTARSGALDTVWAVNNSTLYVPFEINSSLDVNDSPILRDLTLPGAYWPENFGRQHADPKPYYALQAISKALGLGPDPRAQFYSKPLDFYWGNIENELSKLKFDDVKTNPPTFNADQFSAEKKEFAKEIIWVTSVTNYLKLLAAPAAGSTAALWVTFNSAESTVNAGASSPASAEVVANALTVVSGIAAIAGILPKAAGVYGTIVGTAYHAALDTASIASRSAALPTKVLTTQLASTLAERLNAAQNEIQLYWRNIIVSNYDELRDAGECITHAPQCPDPSPNWSITSQSNAKVQSLLNLSLEREVYTGLVPARFNLMIRFIGSQPYKDDPGMFCLSTILKTHPFASDTGLWESGRQTDGKYVLNVLTNQPSELTGTFVTLKKSIFTKMFSPVNENDLGAGGLGINEKTFMQDSYLRSGFNNDPGARFKDSNFVTQLAPCFLSGNTNK